MKKTNRFLVGLLFLVGLGIAVSGILWVAGTDFRKKQPYVAFFDQSIEDVRDGTAVRYRGIDVGRVTSTEIAPDGRLIRVRMELDRSFELREDQGVAIATKGLIGSQFVRVAEIPPNVSSTKPPFEFEVDAPVVPTFAGGRQRLIDGVGAAMAELGSMPLAELTAHWSNAGEELAGVLGSRDLEATVANLRGAAAQAERLLRDDDLQGALDNLHRASRQAETLFATLSRGDSRRNMRSSLADAAASAKSLREATAALERQMKAVPEDATDRISRDALDAVANLDTATRQLNLLLPRIEQLVESLRKRPGQITVRRDSQEPFEP